MNLYIWLYVRVGILLICGKHLHDRVIKRVGLSPKTSVATTTFLKCLCQVNKGSGHVSVINFASFYHFFYWILELFYFSFFYKYTQTNTVISNQQMHTISDVCLVYVNR